MYRTLDTEKTICTLETLGNRIEERFPGSSLFKVCKELQMIASETKGRIHWIARRHIPIRIAIALLLLTTAGGGWLVIRWVRADDNLMNVEEFVPVVEAGLNAVVLLGAALFFLLTLEVRIKRARALNALHELRAISHVIDMHQLTKDPSQLVSAESLRTPSSPKRTLTAFQLTRYLDYCSEMLSLIGKLAALYAQSIPDSVVTQAVNDIETLTNGLSRSIWQKIMILDDDLPRKPSDALKEASVSPATAENSDNREPV